MRYRNSETANLPDLANCDTNSITSFYQRENSADYLLVPRENLFSRMWSKKKKNSEIFCKFINYVIKLSILREHYRFSDERSVSSYITRQGRIPFRRYWRKQELRRDIPVNRTHTRTYIKLTTSALSYGLERTHTHSHTFARVHFFAIGIVPDTA